VVGADRLGPTSAELARLHRVAAGEDEADLLVHGGTLAVVHTGELLRRDVAIVGRFIAAVTRPGALAGRRSLDASGRFLLPAFVDGHLRPERSLLTPGEIARLLVPRGTATVLTDPTGFVARLGVRGGDLATGTGTPLRMLARRPASIATAGPPPGEFLPADTATSTRSFADLIGTGQLGCAVHAATVAGIAPLDALRRATLAPARRHGLDHVLGSITPSHLADLLIVSELGGAGPPDLVVVGGRIAAARGESLFDNLDAVPRWCMDTVRLPVSLALPSFVLPDWPGHPAPLPAAVEVLPRSAAAHPEGQLRDRQPDGGRGAGGLAATLASRGLAVRHVRMEPMARDGHMVADPARDVTKVAVVDRSGRTAAPRVGLVCGVGLASGAIGVTTSAAPGDLLLVGTNDADMLTAARALEGMGGGFVVVDRGWVQAACPLPIAGIVSDAPWEAVEGQLAAADAVAVALGCRWSAPLLTLAALGAELYTHP
jgi:adenine deaminase